jgi:integrase
VNFDDCTIRMTRAKQRGSKKGNIVDVITMSPSLMDLMTVIKDSNVNPKYVFPTQKGMPYTASGFKGYWGKLKCEAKLAGIEFNATFHDLRAYYTTAHKAKTGALPDLHANPETTARIYDRTKEFNRISM